MAVRSNLELIASSFAANKYRGQFSVFSFQQELADLSPLHKWKYDHDQKPMDWQGAGRTATFWVMQLIRKRGQAPYTLYEVESNT